MTQPCARERCDRPVGDADVCHPCGLDIEKALGDVTWLDEQLDIVLARQTSTGERVGGTSAEKSLPYDPRASEARWVLSNTVTTWARVVEEESPGAVLPTWAKLGTVAMWLGTYVEWLRHHPAAAEAFDEIDGAVAQARRLVDTKPERWYAGPCGGLDGEACGHDLYAKPNAARITCPMCGASYDSTARREWLIEAAHDHLATAAEVSRLCMPLLGELVTTAMIRGYLHRGRIAQHGTAIDGRGRTVPLYRVGDVIAAATTARFDVREQRAAKKAGQSS